MSRIKSLLCLVGTAAMLALFAGCGKNPEPNAPVHTDEPVNITVWTYYNGSQLEAFNSMVEEFNRTVGKEKNITVDSYSQGSVNDLETNVLAAAEGKVGTPAMPNIFSAYADNAYALDQMGEVVDLSAYLTQEEKDAYIPGYLTEGDFSGSGSIKIFPTVKSTELLFLNQTDWEPFAEATGADYSDLTTVEGVVETAERYYEWSGGRAMFGRDAMANYMLVGARQLGCTLLEVTDGVMTLNYDQTVVRKLWDNYYVPFLKGYFSSGGRFRSDDVKTGNIIAYVGSTSSSSFFPSQVVTSDTESHDIQRVVLPCPVFRGGENYAVQQGAGMVVTKASEAEIQASVEFLKWFTLPEHNIAFSADSGYLPVTKAGNDMEVIRSSGLDVSEEMDQLLTTALDTVNSHQMYTQAAFSGAAEARSVLEHAMSDRAEADRAVVEERMEQGQSFDQAAEEFLSDDYFQSWYQETLTALQPFEG